MEESIRGTFTETSIVLLMQPLSPALRSFVQTKKDMIVVPLAAALVSLALMWVSDSMGILVGFFAVSAIVSFIVYGLIVYFMKSDYIRELTTAVANRYFRTDTVIKSLDKEIVPLFRNYLSSPHPDEVIYAISALEQDERELEAALDISLGSNINVVRDFSLQKINQYEIKKYYPQVLSLIANDNDDWVRASALSTAAQLQQDHIEETLHKFMDDPSVRVSSAAIIVAFKGTNNRLQAIAFDKLKQMLASDESSKKKGGLFIIGEINQTSANQLLEPYLKESSESVRREALHSVIKTRQIKLLPVVLKNIYSLKLTGSLLKQLVELQDEIVRIMEEEFSAYPENIQIKLLHLLGSMDSKKAQKFLESIALGEHLCFRQIALRSLVNMKKESKPTFLDKLNKQILAEALYLKEQERLLSLTPDEEITLLLRDVLRRRINLAIERLMNSLALYYSNKPIIKARDALGTGKETDVSYAVELIDTSLSPHHKKVISPILNKIYFSEAQDLPAMNSELFMDVLNRNLQFLDNEKLTQLGCMACIYIIRKASLPGFADKFELLRHSDSEFIKETIENLDQVN